MKQYFLQRRLEGLGLSVLLSLLFLAGCLWIVYRELEAILGASKITGSISWVSDFNSVLAERLAAFALTVLLVHVIFGLAVWALARLTRAAFPLRAEHWLTALILAWGVALAVVALTTNAAWYPGSRFAFADLGLPGAWLGVPLPTLLSLGIVTIVLGLGLLAVRRSEPLRLPGRSALAVVAMLIAVAVSVPLLTPTRSEAGVESSAPHIVILGLDSIRNDLSEVAKGPPLTPNVDAFLAVRTTSRIPLAHLRALFRPGYRS